MNTMLRYFLFLVVGVFVGYLQIQIFAGKDTSIIMKPSTYSNIEKLSNQVFENLLSKERVSVRGPVGFFPRADKSVQFRMLSIDGDGYGGIALNQVEYPNLLSEYENSANEGNTLWVVMQGIVQQYETMDQINRETEPDALFLDAEILTYYSTKPIEFPLVRSEK